MALKYYFDYVDLEGVAHRGEIYDENYNDQSIEISGYVELDAGESEDIMNAVRGQGLRVYLDADETLTFEDLFTEQEKTLRVVYTRAGEMAFSGWLTPDGWYEDFVNDKWIVSFDCVDGLGYLPDLAFVDSNGVPFVGKKTMLECISLALKRTGQTLPINVDIDIRYDTLADADEVLANTVVDSGRYVRDDGETIFSCDEVIRDILEPFTAVVTFRNGEWYIYRPIQLAENPNLTYFRYDSDGAPLVPPTESLDVNVNLGAQLAGFYPHHAGANQRVEIRSSIGAFRINYKYGQAASLLGNSNLCTDDNVTIDEWVIIDNTYLTFPLQGGCGIAMSVQDSNGGPYNNIIENSPITLAAGVVIDLQIQAEHSRFPFGLQSVLYYEIKLTGGSNTYWLDSSDTWQTTKQTRQITQDQVVSFIIDVLIPATPEAGDLVLTFPQPLSFTSPHGGQFNIKQVTFANRTDASEEGQIIDGEFHTFERIAKPSSQVKDNKEVATGDNINENYIGTIYKADQVTPTSTWNRIGKTDGLPILGLMGAETLRASGAPTKVFSGGVYGYFPPFSALTIDGLTGKFIILRYSYNSITNRIEMSARRITTDEILTDLNYVIAFDYGNPVKPTIKG